MRRSPRTRWLLANRRYVGLSFAVSHLAHLGALLMLVRTSRDFGASVDAATLYAGGLGFVVIAAMAATSFDRSAAASMTRQGPCQCSTGRVATVGHHVQG